MSKTDVQNKDNEQMEEESLEDEEDVMDQYMERAGHNDETAPKFLELKALRHDDFIKGVKKYLGEPNNKQLEVYVKNFKKNMVLGFIKKAEKEIADGKSTKTRGGMFMKLCKEFAYKTNADEPLSVRVREIFKKINKNRNTVKSKKRKAKKREELQNNIVNKMRALNVATLQ